METNDTTSTFSVFITGQIESVHFPLGPDGEDIFCRYELHAGPDWELVSGPGTGITQTASTRQLNFNDKIVFNMPIEVTYKSTSPFGWPQMILSIFGKNRWGIEMLLGYCRVHMPTHNVGNENHMQQSITTPIIRPKSTNMIADITNWITCRCPELKNPKLLLDNMKCKGLLMESYGFMELQFNIIMRGAAKLGYEWISK